MTQSDEFSIPSLGQMKLREEERLKQRADAKRRKERELREERGFEEGLIRRKDVSSRGVSRKDERRQIPPSTDSDGSPLQTKRRKLGPGDHPPKPPRRGRGRPKGSKNKPKVVPPVIKLDDSEEIEDDEQHHQPEYMGNEESMEGSPLQYKSRHRPENRPSSSLDLPLHSRHYLVPSPPQPRTTDRNTQRTSRISIQPFITPLDTTTAVRDKNIVHGLLRAPEEETPWPRQPERMDDAFADEYVGLSKDCGMFWKLTPEDALPPGLQISIKDNSLMATGEENTNWSADMCAKYHTCILLPAFQLYHSFFLYALQKVYTNRLMATGVDLPEFPETEFEAYFRRKDEVLQEAIVRQEAVRATVGRNALDSALDPISLGFSSSVPFHMGIWRWICSYQYVGGSSDIDLIEDDFEALIQAWDEYAAASVISSSRWYKGHEAGSLGRRAFATRVKKDHQLRQTKSSMRSKDHANLTMEASRVRLQAVNKINEVGNPAVETPTVSAQALTMGVNPSRTTPEDTVRISPVVEPSVEVEVPTSSAPALTMDGNSSRTIIEDAVDINPVVESNPMVATVASQFISQDQSLPPGEEPDGIEKVVLETIASDVMVEPRNTVDIENSPNKHHVDDNDDVSMTSSAFDPLRQFWEDVEGIARFEPDVIGEVSLEGSSDSWRVNSGDNIRIPLPIEFNV